jgi:hypothetical protein
MAARKPNPAKPARSSGANDVDAFLANLEHPLKAEIEAVRALILGADARVREGVKWNAPSFYITEHFATFKLRPTNTIQVVFHTGAKVKADAGPLTIDDPSGLLTWAAKDRCVATLSDMDDIKAKKAAFVRLVKQWIAQTTPMSN